MNVIVMTKMLIIAWLCHVKSNKGKEKTKANLSNMPVEIMTAIYNKRQSMT